MIWVTKWARHSLQSRLTLAYSINIATRRISFLNKNPKIRSRLISRFIAMMMTQLEWMNRKGHLNAHQKFIRTLLLHKLFRVARNNWVLQEEFNKTTITYSYWDLSYQIWYSTWRKMLLKLLNLLSILLSTRKWWFKISKS